ncbi:response regulator [Paenibacillus cymbidii]|uniref:response regulator n=1 Tax=Paenibacillus cymbidii TaxID=1639034 RepID=UPI001436840B|nr:response regulator [Paenibacillus cymbidii]
MKFRTKLFVGFATILALLFVFSFIALRMIFDMNRAMHDIVDDSYSKVKLANIVRNGINSLNTDTTELLFDSDASALDDSVDKLGTVKATVNDYLNRLEQMFDDQSESHRLVQELHRLETSFIASTDAAIDLLRKRKTEEAIAWHNNDTDAIRAGLFDTIKQFNSLQEQEMDRQLARSTGTYNEAVRLIVILVAITLLSSVMVAVWVFRSVIRSLAGIISVMKLASESEQNDRLPRIEVASGDEVASIGHAYNTMAAALEEHARFQTEANLLLQEQNWNKSQVAGISAKYQGVQSLGELAKIVITAIAPAIGANYGVFYNREETPGQTTRFRKGGAYAAGLAAIGADSFALGEGLAGQCAEENRLIVLSGPPDDYIRIGSALGAAAPAQILIVPVAFERQVVAVMEFASFKPFTRMHMQLLEDVSATLGITINSVFGHMQIQRLLSDSQLFTEELQTQSEELQLQQEELKTLNEQLREQYEASEKKGSELERIKLELEEKNKQILLASGYKTEFLTNMSHELRTPLNSLLILSQMLAANQEGNLTTKQIEYAQTISSSGKDLLALINEVLDLSKVEAGKLEVVLDWVKLLDVAEFAKRQFEPVAGEQELQFHVRVDADIADLMIHTDEQRLQQIVQNLLSNAFKFTERGSVSLAMHLMAKEDVKGAPAAITNDHALAIVVADTGIGIPQDKQAFIFEAFRQADGTTSRKYGGTGLGLSICQKMAGLLDGFIQVESEVGVGSTFTLYIPIGKVRGERMAGVEHEAATALEAGHVELPDGMAGPVDLTLAGKTVLLVDDDLRNIYALTTALEMHRIHVLFAENGQEGIQLLLDHNEIVDLVIMDIMMPRMDGYEAIREIRKHERFLHLPIIALTAKAMKFDREKCIEAGASDYISKPILLDQLLSLVRVWLCR